VTCALSPSLMLFSPDTPRACTSRCHRATTAYLSHRLLLCCGCTLGVTAMNRYAGLRSPRRMLPGSVHTRSHVLARSTLHNERAVRHRTARSMPKQPLLVQLSTARYCLRDSPAIAAAVAPSIIIVHVLRTRQWQADRSSAGRSAQRRWDGQRKPTRHAALQHHLHVRVPE
jgi:hypothetical protein